MLKSALKLAAVAATLLQDGTTASAQLHADTYVVAADHDHAAMLCVVLYCHVCHFALAIAQQDCALSVYKPNPRQYVARIPQVGWLVGWRQQQREVQ